MSWLKCLSIIILFLQLSPYTFADTNVTEEAQVALNLLYDQIEWATKSISTTHLLWNISSTTNSEIAKNQFQTDVDNFKLLVNNITALVNNVSDRIECLSSFDVFSDLPDTLVESDKDIFSNLLSLAKIEVDHIAEQFEDLNSEFNTNCLQNRTNCEGVSVAIVDQVPRLIATVKRIPYEFLAEVHILDYRLFMHWANIRTTRMNNYNKAIHNGTVCLASKLELYKKEAMESPKGSILNSYYDMVIISENAYLASILNLSSSVTNIMAQFQNDYNLIMSDILNATFKANQTVNSLLNITTYLNATSTNCTAPDIVTVIDTSISRNLAGFTFMLRSVTKRYKDGLSNLNRTFMEVTSIGLQIKQCDNIFSCDYLLEKIVKKTTDIPSWLQGYGNSTVALLQQTITNFREGGANIVWNALGQLEVAIVNLKDCVRNSLY